MTEPQGNIPFLVALDVILAATECSVGTIHALPAGSSLLELRAQRGIPEAILDRVARVPVGKGMAGLAAERKEPVQLCNLQTDSSGVARPDARQTGSRGSIAVPIFHQGCVCGVLGVGRSDEHEFSEAEKTLLVRVAAALALYLRPA